jgi:hypothetical protein
VRIYALRGAKQKAFSALRQGLPVEWPQVWETQEIDDNNRQDIAFDRASLSDIEGEYNWFCFVG